MPDQTLLPAPRRSRAWHGASAHDDRGGPGADARAARPHVRPVPAELCPRYPRRPRQVADRTALFERGRHRDRGFWPPPRLCGNRFGWCEKYRGLEFIAASLARPGVAHAALIEIFGPVGSEQPSLALRAGVLVVGHEPCGDRGLGMESHASSSLNHPPPDLDARS